MGVAPGRARVGDECHGRAGGRRWLG